MNAMSTKEDIVTRLRENADLDAMEHCNPIVIAMEREAADEIERLRAELETERLRLAACGTAALGYFEGCKDEYKSASLEDVLRMRQKLDEALSASPQPPAHQQADVPVGEREVIYRETAMFDEWWEREQACPEHSLITRNAAQVAWHKRAEMARTTPPSTLDAQGLPPLPEPYDCVMRPDFSCPDVYSADQIRSYALAARPVTQPTEAGMRDAVLSEIRTLAEQGVSHGLLADDYCSQIVAKIDALKGQK